jgi:hypothetical protein
MVGTNTGSDTDLELLGLVNSLSSNVTGVEGSGDDDIGVDNFLVEDRVIAILGRGGYQSMALGLEP